MSNRFRGGNWTYPFSSSLPKGRKNANDEEEYDSRPSKMKTFAIPHSKPYIAAIYIDGKFMCGGSLISSKTVLTAAHCVVNDDGPLKNPESITVVLGAHDISKKEATQKRVTCSAVIVHPDYNYNTDENDLAILHLTDAVEFNENISQIELPSDENKNYDGDLATASGWGWPSDSSQGPSNKLREVTLRIIDNSSCNSIFKIINDKQLCTSGHGGRGTCYGDSGGPFVASTGELIGVTSFGDTMCENGAPSVFTRVTKYLKWIRDNIAE